MLGNLAISMVCGTVYGVTALILDVPYPLALAVIAGILDLIPSIGATIAGIIVALAALSVSPAAFVVFLIVMVVYQQIENYILQPTIIGKAARISGFTVLASVLAFGALFGLIGAIIGADRGLIHIVVGSSPRQRARMPPRTADVAASRRPGAGDSAVNAVGLLDARALQVELPIGASAGGFPRSTRSGHALQHPDAPQVEPPARVLSCVPPELRSSRRFFALRALLGLVSGLATRCLGVPSSSSFERIPPGRLRLASTIGLRSLRRPSASVFLSPTCSGRRGTERPCEHWWVGTESEP